MRDLIDALGLFLVIEGLAYAAAPFLVRKVASELPKFTDHQLRLFGVVAMAIGVGVVWLVRG